MLATVYSIFVYSLLVEEIVAGVRISSDRLEFDNRRGILNYALDSPPNDYVESYRTLSIRVNSVPLQMFDEEKQAHDGYG